MSYSWWPFGDKSGDEVATKSTSDPLHIFLTDHDQDFLRGIRTPTKAFNMYRQSSAVSIPVNWISDAMASIKPVIEKDGEIIKEGAPLDLLNNPSPFTTRSLFMQTLGRHFLIAGNSFMASIGSFRTAPSQIWIIHPSSVSLPGYPLLLDRLLYLLQLAPS